MQHIIRATRSVHCSRGPVLCAKCRAMNEIKWMLLDIDPPDQDKVARPTIEVTRDGKSEWRVYDVIRVFASASEARAYAFEHQVPLITD
ncbi:MAG: hypothetical protein ACYCZF_16445 [Anaerolineae bacterium]